MHDAKAQELGVPLSLSPMERTWSQESDVPSIFSLVLGSFVGQVTLLSFDYSHDTPPVYHAGHSEEPGDLCTAGTLSIVG